MKNTLQLFALLLFAALLSGCIADGDFRVSFLMLDYDHTDSDWHTREARPVGTSSSEFSIADGQGGYETRSATGQGLSDNATEVGKAAIAATPYAAGADAVKTAADAAGSGDEDEPTPSAE